MNKHTLLSAGSLASAGLFLGYVSHLEAGEVGPMAAYMPPAPVSDCDACNDPGFYGGVSLLYLKPYDGGEGGDGDWDFGARGTIGFERPDGLFYELNGFWFDGEYDVPDSTFNTYDAEMSAWYVEGLIGDNLHCGEACLDWAFGIRYANQETERTRVYTGSSNYVQYDRDTNEFEGIGPVIRLDGTRRLTDRVTLYAGVSQAILFGDDDYSFSDTYVGTMGTMGTSTPPPGGGIPSNRSGGNSREQVAFVTELEGGLLFDLNVGQMQGAKVRLGLEGQYWSIGYREIGLVGAVLGLDFSF